MRIFKSKFYKKYNKNIIRVIVNVLDFYISLDSNKNLICYPSWERSGYLIDANTLEFVGKDSRINNEGYHKFDVERILKKVDDEFIKNVKEQALKAMSEHSIFKGKNPDLTIDYLSYGYHSIYENRNFEEDFKKYGAYEHHEGIYDDIKNILKIAKRKQ